jgi:hypothetical protein
MGEKVRVEDRVGPAAKVAMEPWASQEEMEELEDQLTAMAVLEGTAS